MLSPLVSIIVPCFKQAQYLPEALDSVLAQTYPYWECIIVDDGSPDNTEEVSKTYCAKDDRFKYVRKENGGHSSARNFGLKFAKGDYLQYLDCDDLLEKRKFELQINQLRKENFLHEVISVVKHLYFVKDDMNQIIEKNSSHPKICHDYDNPMDLIIESWQYFSGFVVHSWLWSKELVIKTGNWNESLSKNEDGEYFSRILSLAKKVKFCDNTCVYYRHNASSMSNTISERKQIDQLKSVRLISERIRQYRYNEDIKEIIFKNYVHYMWPDNSSMEYSEMFKKDLKELGYNYDIIGRGKMYRLLYFFLRKEFADKFYAILCILKSYFKHG